MGARPWGWLRGCNQDKAHLSLREWYLHLTEVGDPRAERVHDLLATFGVASDELRKIEELYHHKPMPEAAILAAQTANGGFDRATLERWGVPWPPPKGWKRQLMKHGLPWCRDISEREAAE